MGAVQPTPASLFVELKMTQDNATNRLRLSCPRARLLTPLIGLEAESNGDSSEGGHEDG